MELIKFWNVIDEINNFIIDERIKSDLTDEEFATQDIIKEKALKVVELYKNEWVKKVNYAYLTNMNHHTLVKVLNYNWFFDRSLKLNIRQHLKEIPIFYY